MQPIQSSPGAAIATAAARINASRTRKILASIHAEAQRRRALRPSRVKPKRLVPKVRRPSLKVSHIGRRRRPKQR